VTELVTEKFWNCDGKVQFVTEIVTESTPHNFIRHKLICDGSVTICDGNIPSQNFCDRNCDGLFPSQKKSVTEIVTESPSQFPEEEWPWGDFL